ncbi:MULTISPECIES: Na(+)/H(+) antiporter subunit F1 [Bacillota]|uniref:Cation:proton antiporter n=1 Tax=Virgibacillus pantothenticus TaxID=1473 RepID=A0A0L0QPM1_VIRPA|nr:MULTISPECIES: Na(+)/H(+) antiporter subunit F1 [Bacillota]API90609.1 Na(+)/H(+) antiporter subunit F [Virgibacillus sp. 6R]KNE20565.1 cation:proton antiporter [Virgibacillus pantothenticus]MBS7429725.1 Na(+)/H(+) antiporter subunit F1 [Virgibacillus sp. 19R1-5]MBU8565600.1 Na(+)/H(+) antiporter subunit F1 [Virgibacillus pantothenticus]MBU8599898.1 Na(+)/H(+) antiporter subunit F1 [Virgibacillus pantothenticus]
MTNILTATDNILQITLMISFIGIALSLALLLYRVITGPTQPERAVALDAIGINLMGLAGLMSIYLVTTKLNDVILLIGILAFLSTLAIAKYLEKGVIIDRDVD